MDQHLFTNINAALKAAHDVLNREIQHADAKSDSVKAQTVAFLSPVIDQFKQAQVLLRSMEKTDLDASTVIDRLSRVLKDMDSHVIRRLDALDADTVAILTSIHKKKKAPDMATESLTTPAKKTTYSLLKTVTAVTEAAADVEDAGTQHNLVDAVKIPASVKKALADRRKELEDTLVNQVKNGKLDWAFAVPATNDPQPPRYRVGLDGAVGLIELIQNVLAGDDVEYNDLRELVIRLSTFSNVLTQHIPGEVVQFLYTVGRWRKWKEDTKQGGLLDGADPVTGFITPKDAK